jgi:hypothetical protein
VKRRAFITLLGGAAAWPLAARAQQGERMRRIGVLMSVAAGDPEGQARLVAFVQGLQEQGWTVGRNVQLDIRWAAGEPDLFRRYAAELVALAPDVILGAVTSSVRALVGSHSSPRCDQIREPLARVEGARLHRGLVDANDLGNLLDRFAVIVGEVDDLAVLRR